MTTEPEDMPRERASDVPEGAEVRADGSYVQAPEDLTDEQRAELAPTDTVEDVEAREEAERQRELALQDSPPREQGTAVDPTIFPGSNL
jgi:hypothetical protein